MNQLLIEFIDSPITLKNADIVSESMTLTESLCSDTELRFGSCESSVFGVRVLGTMLPITGKKFKATMKTDENSYPLGYFKVQSDKPTADRRYRDIVAYDALYDINNSDVATWYNGLSFPMTLKAFRNSFFNHFGVVQEEATLVNDSMTVQKTIEPEKLSGGNVLAAICEINGVFGHVGRNGNFHYVTLSNFESALFPSENLYPSDDLFPLEGNLEILMQSRYSSCTYEDYTIPGITKLQIRQEENEIGCVVGSGSDGYVVQNNFLVYGKDASELQTIAQNLFGKVKTTERYRPFNATTPGNLTREVGQAVSVHTTYGLIESYVLSRTLSGIQALTDSIEARGSATRTEEVNGINESIIQLQYKTNKLTRTVDETRSEIVDVEAGLQSQINQNAQQIQLRITAGEAEALIDLAIDGITLTANQINLNGYTTINGNFSIDAKGNMIINGGNGTTMTVDGGYIKLQSTAGNVLQIGVGGVRQDSTWLARLINNAVRLGDSSKPTYIDGTTVSINGNDVNGLLNRIQALENQLASLDVPTNSNEIDGDFRSGANGAYMAMKNSTGNQYLATTEWVMNYVTNKLG
jgi:hypothetical protein